MRRRTTPITESVETLRQRENQDRHQPQERRLKALRLLKENPNATLQQVAHLLGRHLRTVQHWWKIYQEQGVQGVVQFSKGGGKRG